MKMEMLAMSDQVQIAIVVAVGPTIIGIINLIHQIMVADRIYEQSKNIVKIETSTNSMKDALVSATAEAAHAQGVNAGIKQAEEKATTKDKT